MASEFNEKLWEERHDNTLKEIDTIKTNQQSQGVEIKTINDAVLKLTFIVDEIHKNYTAPKKSFWETEPGKKILTVLIFVVVILLAAGVGTNVIKEVQGIKIEQKAGVDK